MQTGLYSKLSEAPVTDHEATACEAPVERDDALAEACAVVGRALGIALRVPEGGNPEWDCGERVQRVARYSRVRTRAVRLEGAWWRGDSGPILGFTAQGTAVALLPAGNAGYRLLGPAKGQRRRVNAGVAAALEPVGYVFYRPLADSVSRATDLLMFGLRAARRDLTLLLIIGVAGGLLNMLLPLATGLLFDAILPQGDRQQLWVLGMTVVSGVLAIGLINFLCGIAVLRVEGHLEASAQPALFDRLMTLPVSFFRQYTAGDLADRALGVSRVKLILSESLSIALISMLFALFNAALLFHFDATLGVLSMAVFGVVAGATIYGGRKQLRHQRAAQAAHGEIAGTLLQMIHGVAKLRVSGAEGRAYAQWEQRFVEERRLIHAGRKVQNGMYTFAGVLPIAASMLLFAVVSARSQLSHGTFLAFNVAFLQVLYSGLHLSGAVVTAMGSVPVYERLQPILRARPEVSEGSSDPGTLSGRIEVREATFRYHDNLPYVLRGISLTVEPGEFVAVVSPSGGGKSTLVRLLLGFEQPESGGVYYDGQPLAELDAQAVRRQMGVVLQDGQVSSGTLLSNIIGARPLTEADAWEAARLAGMDEMIRGLPMGMDTPVGEDGTTFSGGQRQQLQIARALAANPRIVIFDEAMSALDDGAQAAVVATLRRLDATRLVIAHRLSTIRCADRIVVLEGGHLVESGTYGELMQRGGRFARMVDTQLA